MKLYQVTISLTLFTQIIFYHYHNISCSVANVLIFHLTHYPYSSPKPRNNTPRGGWGEGEPDPFHVSQLSFCFLQKAPIIAIAQGKFFTEKHQVETELLVSTNQGVCIWNFKRSCFRGPALNTFSYLHVKCKNSKCSIFPSGDNLQCSSSSFIM